MNDLSTMVLSANDPAIIGWPPTLATEIALREYPTKRICEAHSITREQWDVIRRNPAFIKEIEIAVNSLKTEGMSFRIKARMQSEELLKESWRIIHDKETPAAVKADLIKHTVKVAGLDASKDQVGGGGGGSNFQININLA